jgi:pyruvate formate lyase activating enzyme
LPLHFTRFFPDYKMMDKSPTDLKKLQQAQATAREVGCRYVYIGNTNLPGVEDTACPNCAASLLSRDRFGVTFNAFDKLKKAERASPHCPQCGETIAIIL